MSYTNLGAKVAEAAMERERWIDERRRRSEAGVAGGEPGRFPEPDDRPTPRAQWDEVNGRWIEWDESTDDWQIVSVPRRGADDADGEQTRVEEVVEVPPQPTWQPGDDDTLDDIE